MLKGEKILITGPAGRIAFDIARKLAPDNEVWGIARFSNHDQRAEVEALGVTTRVVDLYRCDLSELPTDFDYLLHIAVSFDADSYDRAIRINAESTGLLLEHCRSAKAALVMSTVSVYKPHADPWHAFREDDPLGDIMYAQPPSYSISKISQEAVARYCSRAFKLPVTIARMGCAYAARGGLPVFHMQAIANGQPVPTRWDPMPYSLIHNDDIADQVEALLGAASSPATIVNWVGDEPATVQEWSAYIGDLLGVEAKVISTPVEGASIGAVADSSRRRSITGPCKVHWKDGLRRIARELYPDRVK